VSVFLSDVVIITPEGTQVKQEFSERPNCFLEWTKKARSNRRTGTHLLAVGDGVRADILIPRVPVPEMPKDKVTVATGVFAERDEIGGFQFLRREVMNGKNVVDVQILARAARDAGGFNFKMLFPKGRPARRAERKGCDQSSRQGSEKVRHAVVPLKKREGRPVPGFPSRPISPVTRVPGPPE
jgi:hypothetical protein